MPVTSQALDTTNIKNYSQKKKQDQDQIISSLDFPADHSYSFLVSHEDYRSFQQRTQYGILYQPIDPHWAGCFR